MLNDFREEGRGRQAGRGKGGGGEGWGEGGGRKKHQLVASLTRPLPGMEPATFFFFFLVYGTTLQQTEPHCQGYICIFIYHLAIY